MSDTIPGKIVRKIIFDILIQRSNEIDDACDELIKRDMEKLGVTTEYTGEVGWTACGTRVLADDILEGIMTLEEAVEVLTSEERREAKARCQKWLDEKVKQEEKKEAILGYDCDGEKIEEYRILRFPFSGTVDNWEQEPNIDPRFYCAIKLNNNQAYLISVYDDYNPSAIRRHEKISKEGQIPIIIRDIKEAGNYEVAFDGITNRCWYYDRDRKALKERLQTLVKDKEIRYMGEEI